MEKVVAGVTLEAVQGDITEQKDVEAIVNAANAELKTGGGVAGVIHRAAGPELEKECRPLAPISPGEAVITGAHNLPNHYVIHCLGPVYGVDQPESKLLADCYRHAIKRAEAYNVSSIAFPAISTGVFGYPQDQAVEVAVNTVIEEVPKTKHLSLVRFVLFDEASYRLYCKELEK